MQFFARSFVRSFSLSFFSVLLRKYGWFKLEKMSGNDIELLGVQYARVCVYVSAVVVSTKCNNVEIFPSCWLKGSTIVIADAHTYIYEDVRATERHGEFQFGMKSVPIVLRGLKSILSLLLELRRCERITLVYMGKCIQAKTSLSTFDSISLSRLVGSAHRVLCSIHSFIHFYPNVSPFASISYVCM